MHDLAGRCEHIRVCKSFPRILKSSFFSCCRCYVLTFLFGTSLLCPSPLPECSDLALFLSVCAVRPPEAQVSGKSFCQKLPEQVAI